DHRSRSACTFERAIADGLEVGGGHLLAPGSAPGRAGRHRLPVGLVGRLSWLGGPVWVIFDRTQRGLPLGHFRFASKTDIPPAPALIMAGRSALASALSKICVARSVKFFASSVLPLSCALAASDKRRVACSCNVGGFGTAPAPWCRATMPYCTGKLRRMADIGQFKIRRNGPR